MRVLGYVSWLRRSMNVFRSVSEAPGWFQTHSRMMPGQVTSDRTSRLRHWISFSACGRGLRLHSYLKGWRTQLSGPGKRMVASRPGPHMRPDSWALRCRRRLHSPGSLGRPCNAASSLGLRSKTGAGHQTDWPDEGYHTKTCVHFVTSMRNQFSTCSSAVSLRGKSGMDWV